ncbi:MAG: Fic family protein [Chthoniobacterales bacterium]|nr:Fic family protein [Chthoniobacterales bacterium]
MYPIDSFQFHPITPEILKLIAELDEFKGRWQAVAHLAPERLKSLRKVATIESIGSSTRIEGARLTDDQVEEMLSGLSSKSFANRDEQEVAGYADAMEAIFSYYGEMEITENYLKQLHGLLLKYSTKDEEHRGDYKKIENHVEAFGPEGKSLGVVFQTATPFETPFAMQSLVDWYRVSLLEEKNHPLILIGMFIVTFLAIHPFKDGNGRLSRILATLLLLRAGYDYVPYSSMESIIEANKDSYYVALRRTQQTLRASQQLWEPWMLYFLRTMLHQKNNLAAKIQEEQALQATLAPLSKSILEWVKIHKTATVKELEGATKANRNTIKAHLKQLLQRNYLITRGQGKGTHYAISNC